MNTIDLSSKDNNGRVGVSFADERFWFLPRWNTRDGAWHLDIKTEDETPISLGLKLMLGAQLGRRSSHPFWKKHILQLVDTSNTGIDASYDDLGSRIILLHTTTAQFKHPNQ